VSEKRRDVRYPARILAWLKRRNEEEELLTNDVSYRGAFVRTDAPAALRALLKVSFELPNGGVKVAGHCMVVRVVTKAEGGDAARVPGIGLQFWGPIENQRAWDQFIHELKVRERAGMPAARATDKIRRISERFRMALDVQLGNETSHTRDVSETGMAIRTTSNLPVGTRTTLQIRRHNESVVVDVIIRRRIDEPDFKGVGVEYVDVPKSARLSILAMVAEGTPSEEIIYIDADDPELH